MRVKTLWLIPAFALLLGGCASYEPSSAVVPQKSEFDLVERDGVRVGAKAYVDPEEQKTMFDADLDEADVIAVHVFLENGRPEPMLVRPTDATLALADGRTISPSSASKTATKVGEEGSVVGATLAFGIIGALAASSAEDKARTARTDDYDSKSLQTKDLKSGETANGILFFLPPKSWPAFDSAELSMRFIEPATGRSWIVPVALDGLSFEPES